MATKTPLSHKTETVKAIREREKAAKEAALKEKAIAIAKERYGEDKLAQWEKENGGLFYLPVTDQTGENIEALGIVRPVTRAILSYASTKLAEEGMYDYLEAALRECWIAGDEKILEDDEYFIPAANGFNKIIEQKKANFLKK